MPLDKLILIIVTVIAAAGATIWIATALFATSQFGIFATLPVLLIGSLVCYVAWRVISERLRNKEDDHYDKFDK